MAIKDWRKIDDGFRYDNKNNNGSVWVNQDYHYEKGAIWQVHIQSRFNTHSIKNFKTKSQAMNYAKSYMRTH